MKLIVEAGSTKTESTLLAPNGEHSHVNRSAGINPVTDTDFREAISQLMNQYVDKPITSLYYYGSGCINPKVNDGVAACLRLTLGDQTHIEVQDDLIAVGRGMCQHDSGIVGIIGTGSNIGYYNGHKIIDGIKSCGYLLGDEGSGYHIGKSIYRRLIRDQLSRELAQRIVQEMKLNPFNLINSVYNQSNPRQYLASYAVYAAALPQEHLEEVIDEVFDPFIRRMLSPMMDRYGGPVHLCGSIAYHFADEFYKKLRKSDNIVISIEQSPLQGLIKYHGYGK